MTAMKWWGWGDDGLSFTHDDKPGLAPVHPAAPRLDLEQVASRPVAFGDLEVAEPDLPEELRAALDDAVGPAHVSIEPLDRVVHARGKCLRDLVRHRRGDIGRRSRRRSSAPATRPRSRRSCARRSKADCVLIPFGGGTNISGSLEPPADEPRPVLSVDLAPDGPRARHRRGIADSPGCSRASSGRTSRSSSSARGWTVGHFPDSFTHSTLGGWIATRSSGMQSDKYGDIADLTRAVRVVTPAGVLATRPVPASSTGPSVREMVLGSEGRLGIITEATVHVHRVPGRAPDPRLPLPRLAPRARRDARASPRARPRRRSRACPTLRRPRSRSPRRRRRPPSTASSRRR